MLEPLYALGAAPTSPVRVPTLTRNEGVRQFLEPRAREGGWNLLTLDRAELRAGPRLHIQNGDRKHLDLQEDATFTAIGRFRSFLGHGRWDFTQKPLANGLAVVEFTYEFVSFYERLLREFVDPTPDGVRFAVAIRNAHFMGPHQQQQKLLLAGGPIYDFYGYEWEQSAAPEAWFNGHLDAPVSDGDSRIQVGQVAFGLLRQVYNFFNLTDDEVPYTTDQGDAIDINLIVKD